MGQPGHPRRPRPRGPRDQAVGLTTAHTPSVDPLRRPTTPGPHRPCPRRAMTLLVMDEPTAGVDHAGQGCSPVLDRLAASGALAMRSSSRRTRRPRRRGHPSSASTQVHIDFDGSPGAYARTSCDADHPVAGPPPRRRLDRVTGAALDLHAPGPCRGRPGQYRGPDSSGIFIVNARCPHRRHRHRPCQGRRRLPHRDDAVGLRAHYRRSPLEPRSGFIRLRGHTGSDLALAVIFYGGIASA